METTKKNSQKRFDALAFKAKSQSTIAREISGMKPAEEIAYFQKSAAHGPLSKWWEQVKSQQTVKTLAVPQGKQKKTRKAA